MISKMKIIKPLGIVLLLLTSTLSVIAQKIISEGTLVYDVVIQMGPVEPPKGDPLANGSSTVYLKGNNTRIEMSTSLGKEIIIYNSKSENAVILKEFSGQKLLISLTKENWVSRNSQYHDVKFELLNESKLIAGYNTKKAVATMEDGKSFVVYYSTDLKAANKDYDATFANLPGLPIHYEIESGKMKFTYTISKISLDPVLISHFDFPSSGYRVMTYSENQKMKKGN